MMRSAAVWLQLLLVPCALAGALAQSQCSGVYPQLSCGLGYRDESSCQSAGCCWDTTAQNNCFAPVIHGYNYQQVSSEAGKTVGKLQLNEASGVSFGKDFQSLDMEVTQETAQRTHLKIYPTDSTQWEVPESVLPRPGGIYTGADALTETVITTQKDDDPYDSMEIIIKRKNKETPLFILSKMVVFQEQYVQFVLGEPPKTRNTYGFGESTRMQQSLRANTTYTLWNSDIGAASFDTTLYGAHSFYVQVSESGDANGVLFLNSNAMDVTYTTSETQGGSIGVQSTGGIIDLYVFAGPSVADVVRQYQEVIGKPAMVPYWSLGFHNCRWGYSSVYEVEEVVANYSAAGIPLETQWMDIDYMQNYKDFTLDSVDFSAEEVNKFVGQLHANNQHFVPIVDPGIYMRDANYSSYQHGMDLDVYVKDMYGETPYLAQVWPGPVYFPDWFAENVDEDWQSELSQFHELVPYDGIWIDMNEVSNFCNLDGKGQVCELIDSNPCANNDCCLKCSTVDSTNKYDFPPFLPHTAYQTMSGKTIPMSALHAGNMLEYNVHNMYGMLESRSTRAALVGVTGKRPFILSRSTFMGSGKYTAHWTGDNAATWIDLKVSIITMNNLALFGIPMTGADICGFIDDTTEELCARWIEVGAFSPFSRDHNTLGAAPQELYRWDSVAEASRFVLGLRYRLLPHLYTLMYNAYAYGDTVMNGLWVHHASDAATFSSEGQYMWGNSMLFTPVLEQGAQSVTGYFPEAKWYSFTDNSVVDASAGGVSQEFSTGLTSTNVHVKGGNVIPLQDAAMTTTAVRQTPYTLYVALDRDGAASGTLFLDDGESEELQGTVVEYSVANNKLQSTVSELNAFDTDGLLGTIVVRGFVMPAEATKCEAEVSTGEGSRAQISIEGEIVADNAGTSTLNFSVGNEVAVKIKSDYLVEWQCY